MKLPAIGSIVQIPVPDGWAYAQYTHEYTRPPRYGSLLRIFEGIFEKQLDTVNELLTRESSFYAFTSLTAAIAHDKFVVIGILPIREEWSALPAFRTRSAGPGMKPGWRRWESGHYDEPALNSADLRTLPVLGTWTPIFLRDRVQKGWTPQIEPL